MYAYIKGILAEAAEGRVVIEAGGVGYELFVPSRILGTLPDVGDEAKLYTYLAVREDALVLYGFVTRDELLMFRQLIGVSGIGPRGALSILDLLSPREIRLAVISSDPKVIAKAPGIGKKTAQKVIIELADKIDEDDMLADITGVQTPVSSALTPAARDAIDALMALGYSAADAREALSGIDISDDDDTQRILSLALKNMAIL